jgi:hypothetical protein
MPVQTTAKNFLFPDGCQVLVKEYGAGSYTDIGAINSQVANSLSFDENQIETANAGTTEKQINNMKVEGSFTLVNWDMSAIARVSGGAITRTVTAAAAATTIPDQTISSGWSDNTLYDLVAQTSPTDSTELRFTTQPALTSVTLDPTGTPEVLVEDTEYVVVQNPASSSGWSIQFISANMATGSPTTFSIVVDWDTTNTPIASETLNAGASTVVLNPMAYRFKHTDENGKIRQLDLYSVDPNSGFMQFNFKGANEDGLEEMPITYMAKLDTSRTSGQQLFSFLYETGAQ